MKTNLLVSLLLVTSLYCRAQSPSASIPNVQSYANTSVHLPVIAQGLFNLPAISLGICCQAGAVIDSAFAFHNLFAGAQSYTIVNGELLFLWWDLTAIDLPNDTLFYLSISYSTGHVPVYFDLGQCEFGNTLGQPLPALFTNGSIDLITGTRPPELQAISVYPNPSTGGTQLLGQLAEPARVSFTIYDLSGRALRDTPPGPYPAGPFLLSLPMEALAPGTYLLQLRVNGLNSTFKLVKAER